jgi:hypothetical protein
VETNGSFDDGNPHLVVMNKSGDNPSDIDFYVDDMVNPVGTNTLDSGFDHNNIGSLQRMGFFCRIDENLGKIAETLDAKMGLWEFNADTYDQSEREALKERRPEVS